MEEGKCFVGLEISASKIAAIATVMDDGKLNVIGFKNKNILPNSGITQSGRIENSDLTSEEVTKLLNDLVDEIVKEGHEISLANVNVNYCNPHVNLEQKEAEVATEQGTNKISKLEIDNLLKNVIHTYRPVPGNRLLHCLPKEFFVNNEPANGPLIGKFGHLLEGKFSMVTVKDEEFVNLVDSLNSVKTNSGNLSVENVYLNAIADVAALSESHEKDQEMRKDGFALVNIGAEFTEVSVFHGGSLRYHGLIPMAGNIITQDLKEAFGISGEYAEKVKKICALLENLSFEESPNVIFDTPAGQVPVFIKNAFTVIEWRLREIMLLVKTELSNSGLKSNLLHGVMLTGGTANFKFLKRIFKEVVETPKVVRDLTHNSILDFSGFEELRAPQYSTLLGLVVANVISYDARMDNKTLTPKPIENKQVEPVGVKGITVSERIKNLFKGLTGDEMNDSY